MTLRPLLPMLRESADFEEVVEAIRSPVGNPALAAPEAATAYVVAGIWDSLAAPVVVLAPRPEGARRLTDELAVWCGPDAPVHQFAEIETLPYERLTPDRYAVHLRVRALHALLAGADAAPPLIVASVAAAAQKVLDAGAFQEATHAVRQGDRVSLDGLAGRWAAMGYEFKPAVEAPGMASRRGGILDIYPPHLDAPVRIELFGDAVESIRDFDPETQRSIGRRDSVTVVPTGDSLPALAAQEKVRDLIGGLGFSRCDDRSADRIVEDLARLQAGETIDGSPFYAGFVNHGSLFDYIPPNAVVILLRPSEIEEVARSADERLRRLRETKERRGEVPTRFAQAHLDWGLMADSLNARPRLLKLSPWASGTDMPGGAPRLPFLPPPVSGGDLGRLWQQIAARRGKHTRTVVLTHHAPRLAELASAGELHVQTREQIEAPPEPGTLTVLPGYLRHGFVWSPDGAGELEVLTDTEVFGVTRQRRQIRRRRARRAVRLQDLKAGVYVVHLEHGVARFAGTTTLQDDPREYLLLEYAEGDRLYVPMEQLDRLSPYHGAGDAPPRLTRLGTQEWTRAKARARRSTEQLAGELIALYAARAVAPGFATGPDTPWQDQLEASFPYEETDDQIAAIADVKGALEAATPMDRLVCGDVGYGKTEVAIRAAFKVVQNGRQVAVLVPTTVLAQQHLDTFCERLSGFPVNVAALSRLVDDREQARVLRGLARGETDIVIGTHRLLQKDVVFKNLGLAVIDEEHRFGVVHKERLRRMRREVDVLTMSATPIPRTLYISLAGVRDMSTIDTPPEDRLPIKTYVSEDSPELVREAILRELDRGGQVFYVHNRVKTIDRAAKQLGDLVPEARIGIGHGQMAENDLGAVITDFSVGEFDVLVCTTIIESGLDMPNVNTMLIDRADRFGLSQLYQLRGRIGRGARRAYAYFLVPRGRQLTETAEQRLNTIAAATELGAGYQIAMRDLEIRGAGNILGAEQSGHITAVGFDLYTKLLNRAVEDLKAAARDGGTPIDRPPEFSMVKVDLGLDSRIPHTYVEDLAERLTIYQRLARINDLRDVADMGRELRDRFGPLPVHAQLLLDTVRVRILAEAAGVVSVVAGPERVVLSLREPTGGARRALQKALGSAATAGHLQVRLAIDRDDDEWRRRLVRTLERMSAFRERVLAMIDQRGAPETVSQNAPARKTRRLSQDSPLPGTRLRSPYGGRGRG